MIFSKGVGFRIKLMVREPTYTRMGPDMTVIGRMMFKMAMEKKLGPMEVGILENTGMG